MKQEPKAPAPLSKPPSNPRSSFSSITLEDSPADNKSAEHSFTTLLKVGHPILYAQNGGALARHESVVILDWSVAHHESVVIFAHHESVAHHEMVSLGPPRNGESHTSHPLLYARKCGYLGNWSHGHFGVLPMVASPQWTACEQGPSGNGQ